jgi:hypothetical protein
MKRFFVLLVMMATFSLKGFAAGYGEPELLTFIGIFIIVWGILEVILFFKIWGMTNNVRKLTNHFCKHVVNTEQTYVPTTPCDYESDDYDHRLDNVKVGDKVRRIADGKILEVVSVGDEAIQCRGGMLDGIHSYPKESLSFV